MNLVKHIIIFCIASITLHAKDDDEDPYTTMDPSKREPTPCEVCKFLVLELKDRLSDTGKSHEVLHVGQSMGPKKRIVYKTSELRLIETLREPHICEKIKELNVHAERKGSNRYGKGRSETMTTLQNLVNKGVKVDLGIPYDLWNETASEVSKMQRWCYKVVEDYEDDLEDWYFHKQNDIDLMEFLCTQRYLRGKDQKCLKELPEANTKDDTGDIPKPKTKKKSKVKAEKKESVTVSPIETETPRSDL